MNIAQIYPSKYLKSDELEGDVTYTIKSVEIESLGQGDEAEDKPIIYFNEIEKGLACNKTNANTIAGLYGPETDGWIGKPITLFATEVDFAGRMTLAIRVRMRKPVVAAKSNGGNGGATVQPITIGKDNVLGALKNKVEIWVMEEGGTDYTPEELQQTFRNVMRDLFPGKSAAALQPVDWAHAKSEIENNFDAATKTLLPF